MKRVSLCMILTLGVCSTAFADKSEKSDRYNNFFSKDSLSQETRTSSDELVRQSLANALKNSTLKCTVDTLDDEHKHSDEALLGAAKSLVEDVKTKNSSSSSWFGGINYHIDVFEGNTPFVKINKDRGDDRNLSIEFSSNADNTELTSLRIELKSFTSYTANRGTLRLPEFKTSRMYDMIYSADCTVFNKYSNDED